MTLRRTDISRISSKKCKIKGCKNKSYAIFKTNFLCKEHFREKKPLKAKDYRDYRKLKDYRYRDYSKLKSSFIIE